jgi:membrane protein YqaA with SNARE-associated domain
MIPMIIARPNRAWLIAGVALLASVLGGLLGYAIGGLAFESLGQPILASLGKSDAMAEFSTRFNDMGFWAVLVAGVTPFPYKVITIMSGWTGMPLGTFIMTSILARGLRFFVVAVLLSHRLLVELYLPWFICWNLSANVWLSTSGLSDTSTRMSPFSLPESTEPLT